MKIKTIEIAKALGFEVKEQTVTENGEDKTEYTIVYEGKSVEEIALIADYLKYIEYLAKWDGKLPSVMTDGSATVVIPTTPTVD
jgi:hypothetical protein